eukprot:7814183-Pyramimonas_sp.AAC.2
MVRVRWTSDAKRVDSGTVCWTFCPRFTSCSSLAAKARCGSQNGTISTPQRSATRCVVDPIAIACTAPFT